MVGVQHTCLGGGCVCMNLLGNKGSDGSTWRIETRGLENLVLAWQEL